MERIALTGIKPTGPPHIGNYLGMIKPALELARDYQALYFLADYHALTTVKDQHQLIELTYEVAAAWIALGLDPDEVIYYRQSDVPEVFELTWILDCFTPKGLLNRAHAYKAVVDENVEAGRDLRGGRGRLGGLDDLVQDGLRVRLANGRHRVAAAVAILGVLTLHHS